LKEPILADATTTKVPTQAAILAVQIVMAMVDAVERNKSAGSGPIVVDSSWIPEVREVGRLIREANS
jgi:hypothetical protein